MIVCVAQHAGERTLQLTAVQPEPTGTRPFDGWPLVEFELRGEPTWDVGIELTSKAGSLRRYAVLIDDEYLNVSIATHGAAAIAIGSALVVFPSDEDEPRSIRLGGQATLVTRLGSKLVVLHDLGVEVISSDGEYSSFLTGTVTDWAVSEIELRVKGELGEVRVEG